MKPYRQITFEDRYTLGLQVAARLYFATPHHSWERGTHENTNGLIRQYLPKRVSMAHVTQGDCERIAECACQTRYR